VSTPLYWSAHVTESRVTVPSVHVETCAAERAVPVDHQGEIEQDCATFGARLIAVNAVHVASPPPPAGAVTVVELAAWLCRTNTINTSVVKVAFVHVTDGLIVVANVAEYWFERTIATH
jgi:hypothetical protein